MLMTFVLTFEVTLSNLALQDQTALLCWCGEDP